MAAPSKYNSRFTLRNNELNRLTKWLAAFGLVLIVNPVAAADETDFDYLPAGISFDQSVPTPQQHLGFRVGERHLQHHQLVSYLRRLSRTSPRVSLKVYAYTHGGRPCLMLNITSPDNHKRLEKIRKAHRDLSKPANANKVDKKNLPAIINMGYGVHGDESSASNSAAVVAYYLAAAQGKEIDAILKHCVVRLDPSLNPDGFNRFASWANGHVGRVQNPDPNHAEHNQPFPGGRVNYYWFDLNRDWLPAQHPESQGRLKEFHAWKPNVVLDFHEMGTNSTYFFQPGIPARNNPLTPQANFDLTQEMAVYHAAALDEIGSLYMTEERFDDFYMGKGSTYPDLHGSIGILFEQASSRGHRQDSINGEVTFPFTIRNQVRTSLSSLQATVEMRKRLIDFKESFYKESLELAGQSKHRTLVFEAGRDRARLMKFAAVLLRHDIHVFEKVVDGQSQLIVPVRQPEYRFLLSLTEVRTNFRENIFYDVSTWNLPMAYNVKMESLSKAISTNGLNRLSLEGLQPKTESSLPKSQYYLIDWRSSDAAKLVAQLLRKSIRLRVAKKSFQIARGDETADYPEGTILVPIGIQQDKAGVIHELLSKTNAPVIGLDSGLTPVGIDFGSGEFAPVKPASIAMLIGDGVSRYEAGEVWHLMDTRLGLPLSMLKLERVARTNLDKYSTLVLVSGSYSALGERGLANLKDWVQKGGSLVLIGSSNSWAKTAGLVDLELVGEADAMNTELEQGAQDAAPQIIQKPFGQKRNDAALKLISGAIFKTTVDPTHPLGYGFEDSGLHVFRNNRVIIKPSTDAYQNAVVYTREPQAAGYCSEENVKRLSRSAAVTVKKSGQGTIVVMPQNPNFRAFWHGTQKLMINALLFGDHAG